MDDRTNTTFGWILGAGIVALGASIASGMYFQADHVEGPEEPGYFVDAPEEGAGEDAGPDLGTLLASADAAAGEKVFAKCTACHTIAQGGPNGIGPNLYGVMGEAIGQGRGGFAFSSALSGHGGAWTWENMNEWLKSPRAFASGTKMSFAGLSSPEDRANIMEYLSTMGGNPPPKPAPAAPAAAEGAGAEEGGEAAPGAVEGEPATEGTEAGAVSADQPVATDQPATRNSQPL